jgi:putative peptidoglycan lipid II flippase
MVLVSAGIFFSRVLGLGRDVVLARVWGTSPALAGFVIAFTIPNLLRALFGEGAFSAAFVPVLSHVMEKDGRSRAWDVAAKALTLLGVTLTFLVTAGIVLSSALRPLFGGQVAASTFSLLPWLLPYAVMICLTGGLAGMLNTSGRFAVPAFTPVLLNVCLIAAALVLVPRLGDDPRTTIFALVPAVLCAGVLQLALHVWACRRSGMRVRWSWDPACSEVRRIGMLMLPGLLGTGIVQVNVAVDRGSPVSSGAAPPPGCTSVSAWCTCRSGCSVWPWAWSAFRPWPGPVPGRTRLIYSEDCTSPCGRCCS